MFLAFPSKVNKRWPAIMFADSRIANVPGRIIFLTVSMHTMNGIRIKGVPWGIKCVNICIILLIHPKIINVNHKGNAMENVKVMWLDEVKMYGNRPKKLFIRINKNKEIKVIDK